MLKMECFAVFIRVSLDIDREAWKTIKGAAWSNSGPKSPSLAGHEDPKSQI